MRTPIQAFYAYLREAMFANKITASRLSAEKGVHYTYIYNTLRKNANITMRTAQQLAEACGYHLNITFEPINASTPALAGTMAPDGPIFSARRSKSALKESAEAKLDFSNLETAVTAISDRVAAEVKDDLEAEVEELLNG